MYMSKIKTGLRLLKNKRRILLKVIFDKMNKYGMLHWLSDSTFLKINYWLNFGRRLNLKDPIVFNEKLQWLKLYDRRPEYVTMVDKIAVKDYVAKRIGSEYIIPTLGIWDRPEDVDWDLLPNQFVIKWNHDSGSIVICKDKQNFDKEEAIKKLQYGAKVNGFWYGREWPYKNVKPQLLAEKYMEDETGELKDYKWFCFDGKARCLFIASDRQKKDVDTKFDFFDTNFVHLPFTNGHPNSTGVIEKPKSFEKMKELAEKLSQGYPHLRVDFYDIKGHLYFGEFTLYHWSGLVPFEPETWDYTFGSWLNLPSKQKL